MTIERFHFEGLQLLTPLIHRDERGYFMESFRSSDFDDINFVQDNQAESVYGVIRGLHFQKPPFAQTKLIRVLDGRILDVVVDLRPTAKTFKMAFSIELSADNNKQLLVPKGFAHGYSVLSSSAKILYKVDQVYNPSAECGIHLDSCGVDWRVPTGKRIISKKDADLPHLSEIRTPF